MTNNSCFEMEKRSKDVNNDNTSVLVSGCASGKSYPHVLCSLGDGVLSTDE